MTGQRALKDSRPMLYIRNSLFTVGLVKHWTRLSREAVDVPALGVFAARLDGVLSNLLQLKVPLPIAEVLE